MARYCRIQSCHARSVCPLCSLRPGCRSSLTHDPDRYTGSSHAFLSNALYFLSVGLTVFDSLSIVKRAFAYLKETRRQGDKSISAVLRQVLDPEAEAGGQATRREQYIGTGSRYEMVGLTESDGIVFSLGDDEDDEDQREPQGPGYASRLERFPSRTAPSRSSTGSEGTLHEHPETGTQQYKHVLEMGAYDEDRAQERQSAEQRDEAWPPTKQDKMTTKRIGEICLTWVRRAQVVMAYVTVLSGFVVYTVSYAISLLAVRADMLLQGMCRASFLPSCLAHYIKGSIFFGYGVLTFARYLGAYADLGWAWNRRPATGGQSGPTAEMVECAVIFVYGITQTWMERIGAHAGDPYTVKQVQHISIAVM